MFPRSPKWRWASRWASIAGKRPDCGSARLRLPTAISCNS
jgi:hypothetical protein